MTKLRPLLMIILLNAFSPVRVFAADLNGLYVTCPTERNKEYSVFIYDSNSERRRDLISHCQSNLPIWALGSTEPLACDQATEVVDGGVKLWLTPNFEKELALLSLKPFPKQSWSKREATDKEIQIIQRLSKLASVSGSDVSVVQADGRLFASFPSKQIQRDDDDDGAGSELLYAVAQISGTEPLLVYETVGPPDFIDDIDGDGIPEIAHRPYCDGYCVYFTAFFPKKRILASANQHD